MLLASLAYTAYWFTLADEIQHGVAAWAEAKRAKGIIVEYDALRVTGFPLRMQTQVMNVHIAAPGPHPAWAWRSALLTGNVVPYDLNHIVLNAPQPQEIGLRVNGGAEENYMLAPHSAFASVMLKRGIFTRLNVDLKNGAITGGRLNSAALNFGRVQLHLRAGENGEPQGLRNPSMFDLSVKLETLDYPGFAGSAQ